MPHVSFGRTDKFASQTFADEGACLSNMFARVDGALGWSLFEMVVIQMNFPHLN